MTTQTQTTLTGQDIETIASARRSADLDAVQELTLYAENDYDLYQMSEAISANLLRKMEKNQYEPMKARKAWRHLIDAAWKKYRQEFGHFPATPATRQTAANNWAADWESEHVEEYNAMHDRMDTDA